MSPRENRPHEVEAAPEKRLATQAQDTGERVALRLDRTEVLDAIPAYVIILKSSEGQIRRRVFLSLHSAVKACERAQQRGHAATLELVQYVSRGER